MWILTPDKYAAILAPRWSGGRAREELRKIIAWYRARGAERVSCGWMDRPVPRSLPATLESEGFRRSHEYAVMWLDLADLAQRASGPRNLSIGCETEEVSWDLEEELPYYVPSESRGRHPLTRLRPRRAWHISARQEGCVVGHITLFITRGKTGMAGIYDLGVVPSARRQGIGSALTVAACRKAESVGLRSATLSPSPEAYSMYERVGFREVARGETWRLTLS